MLLDKLGAGAMGVVHAAYDTKLDRKVAIKLLQARGSEQARQRLVREARAMARVSHPNVISVYDVGTFEGRVYIAMEYVDGENLSDVIRRGPLVPPRAVPELTAALERVLNEPYDADQVAASTPLFRLGRKRSPRSLCNQRCANTVNISKCVKISRRTLRTNTFDVSRGAIGCYSDRLSTSC